MINDFWHRLRWHHQQRTYEPYHFCMSAIVISYICNEVNSRNYVYTSILRTRVSPFSVPGMRFFLLIIIVLLF